MACTGLIREPDRERELGYEYAGVLRGHLHRRGLEIAETSYDPRQHVGRHAHDRSLLVVVLGGAMTEKVRGQDVLCSAGTVLFHPAGEPHAHEFGGRTPRCLSLQLAEPWLERLDAGRNLVPAEPVRRFDEVATGAGRLLHTEFRRGPDAQWAALEGLTLTLLASLSARGRSHAERRPDFLRIVVEKLHDDPSSEASLSELARLAGVSPEHLSRTFREAHGVTLGEYLRTLRVERAREELANGDCSLGRLAVRLGFYDQSHFTRTFKAHVGCTPGQFRSRARDSRS